MSIGVTMASPAVPKLSVPGRGQTYHDKYVVVYSYKDVGMYRCVPPEYLRADLTDLEPGTATEELTLLIQDLESAGLETEVRAGHDETLLVFVKAPRSLLGNTVYTSR